MAACTLGLVAQGATYVYFVDEIFLPQKPLLEALVSRKVEFGIQTRIDLWKPVMLDLLGAAGLAAFLWCLRTWQYDDLDGAGFPRG